MGGLRSGRARRVEPLLPTSLVGSYPQPSWLVDRQLLEALRVPRVRAPEVWRVAAERLEEAQDDATVLAIAEQERAGLDVITDGEARRESYSNRFATSLEGVDPTATGIVHGRAGGAVVVPVFSGRPRRRGPLGAGDVAFARERTEGTLKATLPGPFTMSEQAETTAHPDRRGLALDLADAVRSEIQDLFAAGADVVQLDEPWLERFPERAERYGAEVIERAVGGLDGTVAVHVCFGYGSIVEDKPAEYRCLGVLAETSIDQVSVEAAQSHLSLAQLKVLAPKTVILGVLDLRDETVESPSTVATRLRAALEHVPAERLVAAPDCGMKFLPRAVAFAKLRALVEGAALVRAELEAGDLLGAAPGGGERRGERQ